MASLSEVEAILVTALVAALIAVWGIITQRVVARRTATIEHLARIDSDQDMIAARQVFIKLTNKKGGLARYAGQEFENSSELQAIRLVLNDFELMAIGVQFGILDFDFLQRYGKGTIIRDWSLAAPFIYKLRSELNSPAIYHEFEELARWLQDIRMPRRSTWKKLWF